MKKAHIETFFARLKAADPEPKGELNYSNVYTLLVAVVLSAQATDVGVNKSTKALFEKVDNPADMIKLGEAKLKQHIRTIGLFNTKAKNVMALSRRLLEAFDGKVPETREELETLPGRQRRLQHRLRPTDHRRRHPSLPTGQSHRYSTRQDGAGGGRKIRKTCAEALFAARPPLADPARPLCVQGPETGLPSLHC